MNSKRQLLALMAVLLAVGVGVTVYKVAWLGFALSPTSTEEVWTVEAEVSFEARGGPVKVSLNHPDNFNDLEVVDIVDNNPGWDYHRENDGGVLRDVWTRDDAEGEQKIYQRINVYRRDHARRAPDHAPKDSPAPGQADPQRRQRLSGAAAVFAESLLGEAMRHGPDPVRVSRELLRLLSLPENNT
ncbi:MAG: UUP1 family membrane protein, partial [Desulfovibrionaceae bacterium]